MYIYTKDNKFQCSDKPPEEFYKTDKIMERTLRDEIAIAAMQGLCANDQICGYYSKASEVAERAYKIATAMLEARKEKDNA